MYKKTKKVNETAVDSKLESICMDILSLNPEATLIISKKFKETPKKELGEELERIPVIVSTIGLDELVLPEGLQKVGSDVITTWCDESKPMIKVIQSNIRLEDGIINGKKIKNLNLYIDSEEDIKQNIYPKF